ncbi:Anaphase-promoting complex, cyclosome, subunit 3 [Vibrio quintilis]|uniref:Anaphase-promoting complex, cyclosome, subunit 3 n=2 Tax=Vibrio quintilis TaxID=1117707 RepID=A0A1M7YU42_9VIBR|nr:Anaphase-promoting complex, cyclosome, subunit 3 [Vibrio quintilis]
MPGLAAEVSQFAAGKIMLAQKQAEHDQLKKAIQTLRSLKVSKSYDKAYVARLLGVYYWQNHQPDPAIRHLSDAVTYDLFKPHEMWSLKRMLADLLTTQKRYKQALQYYQELVKSVPPETKSSELKLSELWLTIAQLHYQSENWRNVLQALKHYHTFGLPDAVSPLSVQLGAQVQLKQYTSAIKTVKRLLALEPEKKNWWLQLTGLELKLKHFKSALSTLELAQLQGIHLSAANQRLLAQLYGQCGIPERAARILERLYQDSHAPKYQVRIAYYWQQAKEWDKAMLKWQQAAKSQTKYYWQLAQLQMQQGLYQQALQSLDAYSQEKRAQEKRTARVALLRAQVLYKLDRLEPALIQAKKADRIQPSGEAKSWIKYLSQLHDYHQQNQSI